MAETKVLGLENVLVEDTHLQDPPSQSSKVFKIGTAAIFSVQSPCVDRASWVTTPSFQSSHQHTGLLPLVGLTHRSELSGGLSLPFDRESFQVSYRWSGASLSSIIAEVGSLSPC